MKKLMLLISFLTFSVMSSFSQATFLGFDQEQCGLVENPGYTYSNLQGLCSSHSGVYKIFFDGDLVYEKPCEYLRFSGVDTLVFINDSTGFLVESSDNNNVYKTEDYGKSWKYFGYGAPTFLALYVINEHNAYLITTVNGWGALITKASDLGRKNPEKYFGYDIIENEVIINDTIYGDIFCDIDTLSFKVKAGSDTISYKIAFQNEPLPTASHYLSETQFKIYPNPCSDYVYFSQNIVENKKTEIQLYSLEGRLLKTCAAVDNNMYVGDLKKGIYLMEVKIANKAIRRKIVKQ